MAYVTMPKGVLGTLCLHCSTHMGMKQMLLKLLQYETFQIKMSHPMSVLF